MQLDRLTVALRPRTDFEAVDLGLRLAQRHIAASVAIWFMASAPWLAVVVYACAQLARPELAVVILWWLKPMFERPLLHVFSRAVFGDVPARAEWPGIALRQPYTAGFMGAVTWRRFELSRSFNLPVRQLERLRGQARRQRLQVLHLNTGSTAFTLSLMCLGLVWLSAATLLLLLISVFERTYIALDLWDLDRIIRTVLDNMVASSIPWDYVLIFTYWLCEGLIAPFYIAAGFALYLNRRTHLEAWDVELSFRQMLSRRSTGLATLAALALSGLAAGLSTQDAHADEATDPLAAERAEVHEQIGRIVDSDDFGRSIKRTRWVPKKIDEPDDDPDDDIKWDGPAWLAEVVGVIGEVLVWLAVAAAVYGVFRSRHQWLPFFTSGKRGPRRAHTAAGGLLLSDDELPTDIPAQVRELWSDGQYREALSLLYRGALTVLNERYELALTDSDTEGDCERAVRLKLEPAPARYFARIALAWQRLAYGHERPATDEVQALCQDWATIEGNTVE